ncbi:MAG: nucleoside kinase [Clostridiaceae bacterium]
MKKIKLILENGETLEVEKGIIIKKVIDDNLSSEKKSAILARLNGKVVELTTPIMEDGKLEVINLSDKMAHGSYVRTLQFILIRAVHDILPSATITLEHSLNKGLFGEIHKEDDLTEKDIEKIKIRMKEIISEDIPIRKVAVTKEEALKIFKEYNMDDKIRLIKNVSSKKLKLYELQGRYDYFYGSMAYSTGSINLFDLILYKPGFILLFPHEDDIDNLPKKKDDKKLAQVFYETEKWGNILGVPDVGSLNEKVLDNDIIDIIRVQEAFHEKKIAYIADTIASREKARIILIAGPSSSGKTTFAKRLGIQLRVNGLIPYYISLDDYFVDRAHTPKDEKGDYDFESIEALDLKLFNENLTDILLEKQVKIPEYDFKSGTRKWNGKMIELPKNGVLIIEGIHGLNEKLTSKIPRQNKFKIYISALTQLNLDNHNRIATTDVRIIRRIVRDSLSRGYGAEDTLKMWDSIKRGEKKNIFIYQEEADLMFNSSLVYELCILKKYALNELMKIDSTSSVYYEALRLKSFLNFFKEVDKDIVPENSILREFTGGSCFYKY